MSEREPVGSLAEEAARLLSAVQGWLGQSAPPPADEATGEPTDEATAEPAPEATTECRWCPLCRLAVMAKETSPDVREHLTQAAVSLALAVRGLLDDGERTPRATAPLETIDLTEE